MNISKEIIIIAGIFLLIYLIFQTFSGLKIIKVSFNIHKWSGIILTVFAAFHAVIGIIFLLGE